MTDPAFRRIPPFAATPYRRIPPFERRAAKIVDEKVSGSFPFLWIARECCARYGDVLRYADAVDDKRPITDTPLNAATCLIIRLTCEAPWRKSIDAKEARDKHLALMGP
jgi:hypothetical protein